MEPGSSEWLHAALYACVTGLSHSCTEGATVEVLAAWIDGTNSLCVVYQYPYFDGVLGLRRMDDEDMYGDPPSDPVRFGQDIADFDLGEPLGSVAERLRRDVSGVHWWGDLDDDGLPSLPRSDRLHQVVAGAVAEQEVRRAEKASAPRHGTLARLGDESGGWMLLVQPVGESVWLTAEHAAAPDEEIKLRYNLATLERGDYWTISG